jgi:predicted acetylornithine/succinylornithine family transaminase
MSSLKNIIAKEKQYLLQNYARPDDFVPTAGKGTLLWDIKGKVYLDFVTGIAVNTLGHRHPEIIKAVVGQFRRFTYITNLYHYRAHTDVAELLIKNTCADRTFFCNSGTEAVEGAIKFARRFNIETFGKKKIKIISFKNGFHGRTYGALSATAQKKYQKNFGPMLPGFVYATYNDLPDLKKRMDKNTAAVILEFMQGEGGGYFADRDFIKGLAALCKKYRVLLIADEIQTGLGRLGTFMAHDHYRLKPDIITLAKPLGGGLPLGAILVKRAVAGHIRPGDHGTTFGGNPVACAAARVILKKVTNKGFLKGVRAKGALLVERLKKLNHPVITGIRGRGLWVGVDLKGDTTRIINLCRKNGLLICKAGTRTVRFLPPLTVTKQEIVKAVNIFKKSLADS